jgi:hypothetical protein
MASLGFGGETNANDTVRLGIELADGSYLVGTPAISSLSIHSSYAAMDIPFKQIGQIKLESDHKTVTLELLNGDKMKGELKLDAFKLETLVGKVSIAVEYVAAIRVVTGRTGRLADGLVLHYTFDQDDNDKIKDSSGRGNDGYPVGLVQHEKARKGKAVRFIAPDTYLVSEAKDLNIKGWREITVSVWLKLHQFTTYGAVIGRGEVTGEKNGGFGMGVGGIYGGKWNAGGGFSIFTDPTTAVSAKPKTFTTGVPPYPDLEQWYHLLGTCDGKVIRFYVNGKLDGETQFPTAGQPLWDDPASKLVIGTCARKPFIDWLDQYIDGLVDDVMIFNRALSENEVQQLYDSQK